MSKISDAPSAERKNITIVAGDFNKQIVDQLIDGASDAFFHFGGDSKDLKIITIPGAFEIPGAVNQVLKNSKPDAVVTLGAVIRGETAHFDFIAGETTRGIGEISRNSDIPIIFGILTTNDFQQAQERAGTRRIFRWSSDT